MKLSLCRLPGAILLVIAQTLSLAAGEFLIRDGDRVVFLGDSITEQRLYTTYIEAYALTRYPNWRLSFRNVGWGGDTSWLRQRAHPDEKALFAADEARQQEMVEASVGSGLKRDVLPLKPTLVTVKFGMNDHSYQPFREDIFKAYVRSQTQIAKVLEAHGSRVAFLTPQPIEEKRPDPDKDARNESLRRFSDGLKEVAAKTGSTFVDQFDPYMAMLLRERASNPAGFVGGGDAVHPGPIGHTVMAWAILKGLGASALVSRAEIDAEASKVAAAAGCRVEKLKASKNGVSFERIDEALPMPIDPKAEPALKLAPVLDDLDQYELKVTGLAPGTYDVTIDGQPAQKVNADDLAKGVNLANAVGPITEQAREVLKLVFEKNNLYFHRWRDVQLYDFPKWAQGQEIETKRAEELAREDQEIAAREKQIDEARRVRPHRFEVKPAAQ
jgi:GDSL-like lipase/acylhydrolase family protein